MRIKSLDGKLDLKNDGTLELFYIGVGSAFSANLFHTNFFIIKGDHHVLVDFGATGPRALREIAKLEPNDISMVLPTHSHSDHVGGLEYLALVNRYEGIPLLNKPKISMIVSEDYQKVLWDMTLSGGMGWNESDESSRKLTFEDYFQVVKPSWKTNHPREILEVDVGDIHIEMFRTKHIPERARSWKSQFISYGLYIDNRIFCSIDTRFDQDLIDLYEDRSEIMFHDVQFFSGSVHAPLEDLKKLPLKVKKKMLLVHYSDDWKNQDISDFRGFTQQGRRYIFD